MNALTAPEVSALLDVDERRVRKEVEHGVFDDMRTPPRFDLAEIVYLYTVADIALSLSVDDRKRLYGLITEALTSGNPDDVKLGTHVVIKIAAALHEVEKRLNDFAAWKRKLVTSREILGGETVFPNSRLSVRHVGQMVLNGASIGEILEDYPYLDDRDIAYAVRFTRAYPRVGRPPQVRPL